MANAPSENNKNATKSYGPLRALFSVLSAFFGVQSSRNYNHDADHGNIGYIILFGFVATAVLIGAIILLVKILMVQAG